MDLPGYWCAVLLLLLAEYDKMIKFLLDAEPASHLCAVCRNIGSSSRGRPPGGSPIYPDGRPPVTDITASHHRKSSSSLEVPVEKERERAICWWLPRARRANGPHADGGAEEAGIIARAATKTDRIG